MRKKAIIPQFAIEKINSNFSTRQAPALTKLFTYIFKKCIGNGWVDISKEHFVSNGFDRQHRRIKELINLGLIQRQEYYKFYLDKSKKGQCKRYMIPASVYVQTKPIEAIEGQPKTKRLKGDIITQTKAIIRKTSLNISDDFETIVDYVDSLVTPELISTKIDTKPLEANYNVFYLNCNDELEQKGCNTPSNLRKKHPNLDVFIYDNKLVYCDLERFLIMKLWGVRYHYYNKIGGAKNALKQPVSRNLTNYRLDHFYTTFPSLLRPLIEISGVATLNIDLSNSQFTVCAALMSNPELYKAIFERIKQDNPIRAEEYYNALNEAHKAIKNIKESKFSELVKAGRLYNDFAQRNSISRKHAKGAFFLVCFASDKAQHPYKQQLKELYPDFWVFAKTIKKLLGSEHFPIILQIMESIIFIDCILSDLLGAGYEVLSFHDSIMCKEQELTEVKEFIEQRLSWHLEGYTLKVEGGVKVLDRPQVGHSSPSNVCHSGQSKTPMKAIQNLNTDTIVPLLQLESQAQPKTRKPSKATIIKLLKHFAKLKNKPLKQVFRIPTDNTKLSHYKPYKAIFKVLAQRYTLRECKQVISYCKGAFEAKYFNVRVVFSSKFEHYLQLSKIKNGSADNMTAQNKTLEANLDTLSFPTHWPTSLVETFREYCLLRNWMATNIEKAWGTPKQLQKVLSVCKQQEQSFSLELLEKHLNDVIGRGTTTINVTWYVESLTSY